MNDDRENKKTKGTKKCVMKRKNMFENYTDSLFNSKIILKSQQRFKGDHHKVYAEEVNKIALCSNDDKRLQIFDRITPYPHETNAFKICENVKICLWLPNTKILRLLKQTEVLRLLSQSVY